MNFSIDYNKIDAQNTAELFLCSTDMYSKWISSYLYATLKYATISTLIGIALLGTIIAFVPFNSTNFPYLILPFTIILNLIFATKTKSSMVRNLSKTYNNQPVHFNIDSNGISIKTSTFDAITRWDGVYKVASNEKVLLIYLNKNNFYFLPRRVFSEEDWQNLLAITKQADIASKTISR
jgi:hypothetical protein